MLQVSSTTVPPERAVKYKFKSVDLSEYFEELSPEQTHIALEGALNSIFGQATIDPAGLSEEGDGNVTDEEDRLDHVTTVASDTVIALFDAELEKFSKEEGIVSFQMDDNPEESPLSLKLEGIFNNIVEKLQDDIVEDKYNQDITTLQGEMEFFSRLELFTYQYDSKNGVLSVTVAAVV